MEEVKLLDAGPIVALMDQREQHHPWARETFARLALPLVTCQAALTEASHLLRDEPAALARLMRHVAAGHLVDGLDFAAKAPLIAALMEKYADVPMSFADACIVAMADAIGPQSLIVTLDSDFQIYRRADGSSFALLAPFVS